jgi:hypothetical protein
MAAAIAFGSRFQHPCIGESREVRYGYLILIDQEAIYDDARASGRGGGRERKENERQVRCACGNGHVTTPP